MVYFENVGHSIDKNDISKQAEYKFDVVGIKTAGLAQERHPRRYGVPKQAGLGCNSGEPYVTQTLFS